jgi:transposase, IS30 family
MYSKTIIQEFHQKHKHLTREERFLIQYLYRHHHSAYAIAKELHCAPNTIRNELKKGCPDEKKYYSADLGQKKYSLNRARCHRPMKLASCEKFINFAVRKFHSKDKWSVDAGVGNARLQKSFPAKNIPCTKTVYNWINRGLISITRSELPEAAGRKKRIKPVFSAEYKMHLGKSIEQRPESVDSRKEFGHWEIDTVIGQKKGKHSVLLTLTERKTRMEIIRKIEGKTKEAVNRGLEKILEEYRKKKFHIFKSITADNGLEFAGLSEKETEFFNIYFAHPYSSYERGTNEHHNRMIRRVIPKSRKIDDYSVYELEELEDWMNNLPRKLLGYKTPAQLFEEELDNIYRKTA